MADQVKTIKLEELKPELDKLMAKFDKAVRISIRATAKWGEGIVKRRIPVAFKELQDSVHGEISADGATARIVIDAPHAAAVEKGSRPHMPPLEPILKWVKLRGMQGLTKSGKIRSLPKRELKRMTPQRIARLQAHRVASELHSQTGENGSVNVDAAVQVAENIREAIAKKGTKAYHYAYDSIYPIGNAFRRYVDYYMKQIRL